MAETTDNSRVDRRRKVRKLAYVGLVIAMIILAWQVHEFFRVRSQRQELDVEGYNIGMTATTGPAWPSSGPGAVIGRGVAVAGLVELAGDPGDIPPPPGASRIRSFERKALGFIEQQGRYQYRGSSSSAEEHYGSILAARGFTPLGAGGKSRQRRTIVFVKAPLRVIVSLPNIPEEGKIVSIVLTVVFPEPKARD
jgi:hypothetical protein